MSQFHRFIMKYGPNSGRDQSDRTVALASFLRGDKQWVCKASGPQAIAFGATKSEAKSNLALMLVLARASGVAIARAPGHPATRSKPEANQA